MKTVKVRIAVVVNENGEWKSAGWNGETDKELLAHAKECFFLGSQATYFIEAEVPVPESTVIQGKVLT